MRCWALSRWTQAGYSAALYYIIGYLLMVLACFVVICKVSRDGVKRRASKNWRGCIAARPCWP